MTRPFFVPPAPKGEPSARLAFAGNRIDRRSEHRAVDCLETARADSRARAFACLPGHLVLSTATGEADGLLPLDALAPLGADWDNAVVIGYLADGAPRLAVPVGVDPEALPEGLETKSLRAIYAQGLLPAERQGEMAQGASLVAWNLSARFCGRCGAPTLNEAGGYRRKCTACGHVSFPRTDPVVIMLALDEANDRCLLGRSPHFPPGMYSCLAGFLEPGETMEDAVRRETKEEAGIIVDRVRYHASQPWPMPHTIMIGFYAEARTEAIARDTLELEDCRWFTRAEALRLLERRPGELTTAFDGAIANLLLRDWAEGRA